VNFVFTLQQLVYKYFQYTGWL